MSLSFWHRSDRAADAEYDVGVVGGGIIGCSTAYWLKRVQPSLRVAVLDAGRLASGASGRNAGFILQGTSQDYASDIKGYGPDRARRLWQFTRENRDLMVSELDSNVFRAELSGSMVVAGTAAEDERLRSGVSRMRADGAPVAYLPPDEVNKRLGSQGFLGGLYVPSGAVVHPVLLVRHIAERSGAELLEHHGVHHLDQEGRWAVLETPHRRVRVRQAVLALNAYLPRLLPALGRYVRPVRAQMLATEPVLPRWLHLPAYSHEGFFYIRQNREGEILLGGARNRHAEAEVGYEDETTDVLQADLEAYLHTHFPQTAGVRVAHRWSGTMGFSPDGLPSVGPVPGLAGSYWAAGFTGHGMGYGFRFGRMLAEVALGQSRPEGFDLFDAARFAKERPKMTVRKSL